MEKTMEKLKVIEKEIIPTLHFPGQDVLEKETDKISRMHNLQNASEYGNVAQHKVAIYFKDNEGPKMVETTIWEVTTKQVILKHNIIIPVNRVYKVAF